MGSIPLGDYGVLRGFREAPGFAAGTSATLVLDGERGELVRTPARVGKKGKGGVLDARVAMALKSHSEAERRRRQRINGHLTTLRSMIPCTDKLDKAALLAEVINHVKRLKSNAVEISKGCTLPSDVDEVRVEVEGDEMNGGSFIIKASLCCEDRPDLLADIRQTLQTLQLKTIRAEISTLGGRVKNAVVVMCEGNASDIEKNLYASSVHQALKSILDRVNSSADLLPRTAFSNKRLRISPYASSSSSS
ncbi:transcription factor bHLH30-like [Phoenix dactylifera]|uniref:Transcription factor bHLH30-like n=1 Tax=Phoenix dactylifera TaxID=42345 RepID=A0A8B8ZTK8_PHODC|nr:transcription factor bHLH30-like [Phoenix dactylifera]XP_038976702.1 transcription factor bHLH30-like [Phoenix dactylifera]